jgi:hypothetical protein
MKQSGTIARERIWFGIALTCLAVAVIAAAWVLRANALLGSAEIEAALARYDRMAAVAAYQASQPSSGGAEAGRGPFEGLFLAAGTPSVVGANLQSQIKQLAANQGVEVMQASSLPVRTEGPLTMVGGGFSVSGTVPAIYALLRQIDQSSPLLFLEHLDIRVTATGADERLSETMAVANLEVFGALRAGAASGGGDQ